MALQEAAILQGFTALSDQVFVRQADVEATPGPNDPDTVILYGWGDARLKHVAKYADGYLALYPGAKMVLILSPMIRTLSLSLDARAKTMQPVLEAVFVNDCDNADDKEPRILVHAMSNTGGISLASTMYAFKERHKPTGKTLPIRLLVLDSTPGSLGFLTNLKPWSRGIALGIGHWFPWPFFVTQGFAAVFLGIVMGAAWLTGNASAPRFSTFAVNDPELSDLGAKRLYAYSKGDELISWEAIEGHAAEARTKGYDVTLERFEGSAHVGHMRLHPEQYWNSINDAWSSKPK